MKMSRDISASHLQTFEHSLSKSTKKEASSKNPWVSPLVVREKWKRLIDAVGKHECVAALYALKPRLLLELARRKLAECSRIFYRTIVFFLWVSRTLHRYEYEYCRTPIIPNNSLYPLSQIIFLFCFQKDLKVLHVLCIYVIESLDSTVVVPFSFNRS